MGDLAAPSGGGQSNMIFPNTGMQVLSSIIYFLGVAFLTHCLSRRANLTSLPSLMAMTWARICVIIVFVDSWLFLFISGVMIFGVGLEYNLSVCSSAIYLCIGCYGTSKLFIYLFLIERVYVVWALPNVKRLKSPIYIFCIITVTVYGAIAALLLWGQIHYFRPDGACKIGLRSIASISLLTYDLYINLLLTTLFLWPLFRSKYLSGRIKRVATRTLLAAGAALTTSTVNIAVLTILHGEQLGWVCLGSCGTDVLFNALAIYWVTSPTSRPPATTTADTNPIDKTDGSIPNPRRASRLDPLHEGTCPQNHEVDAEGYRNGERSKVASFFKSISSRLGNKDEEEKLASGVIGITVHTTTEHEMVPIPRSLPDSTP